jgi:hypothetical protein
MTDEEKRAAEIDAAVREADAKKRADAEGPTLADVMAAIGKCSDAIEGHGKMLSDLGDRVGVLETPAVDDDANPSGDKAKAAAAVDAKKRADAAADLDGPDARRAAAECQMRADAVALAFNERAPQRLSREPIHAYRVRLLTPYLKRSPTLKDISLDELPAGQAFDMIEKQIFADAVAWSRSPDAVAPGQLLMVEKKLDGGHVYRTFQGHPRSWMDEMAGPVRQHVKSGLLGNEGALAP